MRQAKEEDCWNHDSDDDPPPWSGDSLGQVLDRVSAIRRLLAESYGRNGDDRDRTTGTTRHWGWRSSDLDRLKSHPSGLREFVVTDPDGNQIRVGSPTPKD